MKVSEDGKTKRREMISGRHRRGGGVTAEKGRKMSN